jgi:ActR/RegA family two-component response regulator
LLSRGRVRHLLQLTRSTPSGDISSPHATVDTALTAADALAELRERCYFAVVVDLHLGSFGSSEGLSVLATVAVLKPTTRRVLMTGDTHNQTGVVDAVLLKPFGNRELLAAIALPGPLNTTY